MKFNLGECEVALIVGAGHGIGLGFVEEILNNNEIIQIYATYRNKGKAENLLRLETKFPKRIKTFHLNPTQEEEFNKLSNHFDEHNIKIDIIINSVGFLHDHLIGPEKSLRSLDIENFLKVIKIKSCITPMIAKVFEKYLRRKKLSIFASISAKVRSIEDNAVGGWYSYRASKAALNMLIKNISIEFERKKNNCIVLSLHPGTTKTELSKPFIQSTKYILHTPQETAANLLKVLDGSKLSDNGRFYSWDNTEIPW